MAEVLVLQHAPAETLGSIADALDAHGHRWRYIRPFAGEPVPGEPGDAGGLVVMGGPMSAYETDRYPFLAEEMRLITAALDEQRPILGVCLGSQLLAAALGARVYASGEPEIGWYPVQLHPDIHTDPILGSIGRSFMAFHWHGDVFALPRGACALGHSARTLNQGFRYGARAYALQFHLEVTAELVDGMLAAFGRDLAAAGVDARTISEGTQAHLADARALGARVFGGWAALVR